MSIGITSGTIYTFERVRGEVERGVKVYEGFYEHEDVWSKESLERRDKLRAWRAQQKEVGEAV